MDRVVVLRPGALGDGVVALPVLESLGRAGLRVLAIGPPVFRLAVESGLAAEWIAFDDPRLLGLFAEGGRCDLLAGSGLCLSYCRRQDLSLEAGLRRSGVARVVSWPSQPEGRTPIVDHLLGALEAAGLPAAATEPSLPPQAHWLGAARACLAERGIAGDFIAIHPGSGGRAKRWPAERFTELAERLGSPVLWLLGQAEAEDGDLRRRCERAGAVAEDVPLATLAGLLAACRLYVGNDSGVSHLAAAVGARTVAIFGETDPRVWAPRGRRVAVVDGSAEGGLARVSVDRVLCAIQGI